MSVSGKKHISEHYAKTLFECAKAMQLENDVHKDLTSVNDLIISKPEYRKALFNSVAPSRIKMESLVRILDNHKVHEITRNFLQTLVRNGRMHFFAQICERFHFLLAERDGIKHIVVESAEPLSQETISSLEKMLSDTLSKTVIIANKVETSLLGGLIFKIDSTVLDCSLRYKLHKLERVLLSTPIKV